MSHYSSIPSSHSVHRTSCTVVIVPVASTSHQPRIHANVDTLPSEHNPRVHIFTFDHDRHAYACARPVLAHNPSLPSGLQAVSRVIRRGAHAVHRTSALDPPRSSPRLTGLCKSATAPRSTIMHHPRPSSVSGLYGTNSTGIPMILRVGMSVASVRCFTNH